MSTIRIWLYVTTPNFSNISIILSLRWTGRSKARLYGLVKLLKDDGKPKRPAVPRGNNSGAPDIPGNTRQARTTRRTFVNSRTEARAVMPQIGLGPEHSGQTFNHPRAAAKGMYNA